MSVRICLALLPCPFALLIARMAGTVTMRERRLTSLEGLRTYDKMHTLFLQVCHALFQRGACSLEQAAVCL